MSKCKNLVVLVGHVGKDPEIRYTPSGTAKASFSLATSEKWKDKTTQEMVEKTVWHNIIAWGKSAEFIGEYINKGDFLYVEGKIDNRSWDKDDGTKGYVSEIVARDTITLRSKEPYQGNGGGASAGGSYQQPGGTVPPGAGDDGIPF